MAARSRGERGRDGAAPDLHRPVPPYGVTLAYGNAANWTVLEAIRKLAASGTPTVVIVNMDRPVILTEFIDSVAGVFAAFGASDAALLDVVFGKSKAHRKVAIRPSQRYAVGDGAGSRCAVRYGRPAVQVRLRADVRKVTASMNRIRLSIRLSPQYIERPRGRCRA